jgi:hypothetical protein
MTPSAPRDATAHRFVVAASMALTGAGVLALLLPLVTGRAMLVRDLLFWVIPSRGLVRDAWAHGTPTAWNAFEGLGFATAADPLFMPFYPPNVLTLWLPLHWGTSLLFGLHIALGTLGAYGLARRFDASAPSAAVGALAWCLAGLTGSMIPTGTLLLPSAWIPALACAAVDLGTAARRGASTLSAALALGLGGAMMLLTGEVFVTLMAALPVLGCLYAATRDASAPDARARPLVGALASGLGLAALLALCLSAPSWWPALQLLGATPRSLPLSPAELDVWSMHPLSLADLVSPNAFARRGAHPRPGTCCASSTAACSSSPRTSARRRWPSRSCWRRRAAGDRLSRVVVGRGPRWASCWPSGATCPCCPSCVPWCGPSRGCAAR